MFGTALNWGAKVFDTANKYSGLIGTGIQGYSAYQGYKQGKESLSLQKEQHKIAMQDRQSAADMAANEKNRLKRSRGITNRFASASRGYGGYSVKNRLNELADSRITLG